MARLSWTAVITLGLIWSASAQTTEDELRSKLARVRYSPLAESARIQGEVALRFNAGVATIISGHPILTKTAVESAKELGLGKSGTDFKALYHFVLTDADIRAVTSTVRRGNMIERAVLRMFGRRTEKVIIDYECQEGTPPANDIKVAGSSIEVWIHGRSRCLQTESTLLVAKR